jgi:uncharacterized protein (DUF433 family)
MIVRWSRAMTGAMRLNVEQVISCNPEVMGGTPVFRGTRVPVRSLIDHLQAGDTLDDFLTGFPSVTREQVDTLLALAQSPKFSRF